MLRLRIYAAIVLVTALVGVALLSAPAESYRLTRVSLVVCAVGAVLALGVVLHRPRWLLAVYAGAVLLALGAVLVPGGAGPGSAAYATHLRGFQGVPYHWGGESHGGIDCSGLLRAGYVEACVADAWGRHDPRLLRLGFDVWFNDCSAEQILNGYGGRVARVQDGRSIDDLDYATLQVGDMAVTEHGIHCLVYVGDHAWASADPGANLVVIKSAPDATFQWYTCPVGIRRWQRLN